MARAPQGSSRSTSIGSPPPSTASPSTPTPPTSWATAFELRLGLAEPTKRIQSVEEWIYAWSETTKALVWVFPHRRAEAEAYQQYIVSHFKSTARRFHPRILLLDKRVRILVASRRDLTLASFHAFTEAERSFLSPIGADYSADSPSGSGAVQSLAAATNLAVASTTGPAHLRPPNAGTPTSASRAGSLGTPLPRARLERR